MVVRLAHVCIETTDLERTEAFYRVLGLERRFEFRNLQGELVGFYLAFGNRTFIEVIKTGKSKPEGVIQHFAIEVADIDEAFSSLKENGIEVTEKELAKDPTSQLVLGQTHASEICAVAVFAFLILYAGFAYLLLLLHDRRLGLSAS